jgi:hypothetical protein
MGATTTTTTTTPGSTTTTTLPYATLRLTRATVYAQTGPGAGNGKIRLQGDFPTPPSFAFPPEISVRVEDQVALDQTHTFASCVSSAGRIRCSDRSAAGLFKADFRPSRANMAVIRFKVSFSRIALAGPFTSPIRMTLADDYAVVRVDEIQACRQKSRGVSCREP